MTNCCCGDIFHHKTLMIHKDCDPEPLEYNPLEIKSEISIMDVLSESSNDSTSEETFDQIIKACIWCGEFNPLQDNKRYCQSCCTKMYRECSSCKKPYPHKRFYKLHDRRCNACHKKNVIAKQKRSEKLLEVKSPATVVEEDRIISAETPSSSKCDIQNDEEALDENVKKQAALNNITDKKIAKKTALKRGHPRQFKRSAKKCRAFIPIIFED